MWESQSVPEGRLKRTLFRSMRFKLPISGMGLGAGLGGTAVPPTRLAPGILCYDSSFPADNKVMT